MVIEQKCCRKCGSSKIVKNGSNAVGNPKYKCKDCGFGGVFQSLRPGEQTGESLLKAAMERPSARGLGRVFGVSYQTALRWTKKSPVLRHCGNHFACPEG